MPYQQIIIACRSNAEAQGIRNVLGQPSIPAHHKSSTLLEHLSSTRGGCLIMTPLMMDETAHGILTKAAILQNSYNILYACHGSRALNLMRLYGCGCSAILGSGELDMLPDLVSPERDFFDHFAIPPFFIDDDVSDLRQPPIKSAHPLHITFLGSQAIMSCANAILNISVSETISMACVPPRNPWALAHIVETMGEFTLWKARTDSTMTPGYISFCNDLSALISLEPTAQHFVVCHGSLSEQETAYIAYLSESVRVFRASNRGYSEITREGPGEVMRPEKLWNHFISALYGQVQPTQNSDSTL